MTTFASPIKLYGGQGCGSAAVEVMLEFAEKPYEFIIATPWEPTPALDDLRRINPLAQVPTLVLADGIVMSESAAIMIMLGEAVHGMVPTEANERAAFFRWMIFIPANIYALFSIRDFPARWVDDEAAQTVLKNNTTEKMKARWQQLESALHPAPYLLGPTMSALDVYVAMMTQWTPGRAWFSEHCPKIMGAVDKTEQHPVVASVWNRNFKK